MRTTRATSRSSAWRSGTHGRWRSRIRRSRIALCSTRPTRRCEAAARSPVPQLSLSITRELMVASGRLYYLVRLRSFLARAGHHGRLAGASRGLRRHVRGAGSPPARGSRARAGATADGARADAGLRGRGRGVSRDGHRARANARSPRDWEPIARRPAGRSRCNPARRSTVLATAEPSVRWPSASAAPRGLRLLRELRDAEAGWHVALHRDHERQRALRRADRHIGTRPAGAHHARARVVRSSPRAFPGMWRRSAATRCLTAGEALILNPDLVRDALSVTGKLQADRG